MDHILYNDEIFHICPGCGCLLPQKYEKEKCAACQEQEIFEQVREYIRNNVVNEYDVASHFKIPLRMVKKWIKEGRIEYCDVGTSSVFGTKCNMCGKITTFGTVCPQCLKKLNHSKQIVGFANVKKKEDSKIRYFIDN